MIINPINAMVYTILFFDQYQYTGFVIDCVEAGSHDSYNVFFKLDDYRTGSTYNGCMTVWILDNKLYGEW